MSEQTLAEKPLDIITKLTVEPTHTGRAQIPSMYNEVLPKKLINPGYCATILHCHKQILYFYKIKTSTFTE